MDAAERRGELVDLAAARAARLGTSPAVRGQSRLGEVLARMAPLVLDDEQAARTTRVIAEAEALSRRHSREALLERERIELEPHIRKTLLSGEPLDRTRSVIAVDQWLARREVEPVLILSGGTGCGKSVAAALAAVLVADNVVFRSAMGVLRTFAGYFGEALELQQRMFDARLLVIDDLGAEVDSGRMTIALIELLERRKDPTQHRTLITTNLGEEQFFRIYCDARLESRLSPRVAGLVLDPGPDLRKLGT